MKNEKSLGLALTRSVKRAGGYACVKLHDVSTGGLPDNLVVVYGITLLVETKFNRRVTTRIEPLLSPLQRVMLPQLSKGNAVVAILAYHERSGQFHAYRMSELDKPAVVADSIDNLLHELTNRARG